VKTIFIFATKEKIMQKNLLWILFTLCFQASLFAAVDGRFMDYPAIRGDKIVFTFENDLWLVSDSGGLATRLTTHPGTEYAAQISPDGKLIAFSGNYNGGTNVYLMPITGGTPKRLTYRSSRVVAWTPDGSKIVFRSSYENTYRPITKLYAVTPDGKMPEKLPIPRGVLCSFSPDGRKMVYNRRGREDYYWKRYKGGNFQDIWLYNFENNKFEKLTNYVGKNSYPMWIRNKMYFVSDRGKNGIANLYSYDFAGKKIIRVTNYDDFDVRRPSTDGERIIYLHSGFLYILNTTTGRSQKIDVQIPTDNWQLANRTINPNKYIHSMSVTDDGDTAVFAARGDVFLVPTDKEKETRNLTDSPGTRERYPQISPDGKWIAFFSDKSGEYELYIKNLKTGADWISLTKNLKTTLYHLEWSPDSKKILFGTKDFTLYYIDINSKKLVKIDSSNQLKNDEFYWEISDYTWSPDSKWVAYSFVQNNRNSKIFLYNIETKKRFPVTDNFYDNLNPSFDANGDYLYFLSYRNFNVQMDVFEDDHIIPDPVKVMVVQLKAGQKPPFIKDGEENKQQKDEPFRIDTKNIMSRIFPLPVKGGNYFYLKAGKGYVTWASVDRFGEDEFDQIFTPKGSDKFNLHIFNMKDEKKVSLDEKISDWKMSSNREQMIIKKKNAYYVEKVEKAFSSKKLGKQISLDNMIYHVNPHKEWTQIFNDTWRWYRDFFYDPNMHGRNWKKMGETYRSYLPQIHSRSNLNWLLSQMVGELCVSHTYIFGGDDGPQKQPDNIVHTGFLGAELQPSKSGYYKLHEIFGPTEYNRKLTGPLVRPDFDIAEGDYLISIDGREIKYPENPYKYLQVVKGQKISLTANRKPSPEGAKTYRIKPTWSEYSLRYNRWLADNIHTVLKESHGDIGYIHLTAMSSSNVAQFDKFWRAFRYKKGLIIDVRGNGGGWTEYFAIDKLERKMVAYNCLHNMESFRYPGSTSNAHLVVLTNEYNGSDGEAFVEHFKAEKLGTVIGVPSWGGLVGIVNAQKTIDNGTVYQSNNSFYGREGKWLVENHGADPDILVENDPASRMQGVDKQLETGIKVLMKQIKEHPFIFPQKPAYPVK